MFMCTIRAEAAVVGAIQRLREVDAYAVVEAWGRRARVAFLAVRTHVPSAALALVPFLPTHHIERNKENMVIICIKTP